MNARMVGDWAFRDAQSCVTYQNGKKSMNAVKRHYVVEADAAKSFRAASCVANPVVKELVARPIRYLAGYFSDPCVVTIGAIAADAVVFLKELKDGWEISGVVLEVAIQRQYVVA